MTSNHFHRRIKSGWSLRSRITYRMVLTGADSEGTLYPVSEPAMPPWHRRYRASSIVAVGSQFCSAEAIGTHPQACTGRIDRTAIPFSAARRVLCAPPAPGDSEPLGHRSGLVSIPGSPVCRSSSSLRDTGHVRQYRALVRPPAAVQCGSSLYRRSRHDWELPEIEPVCVYPSTAVIEIRPKSC